LHTPTNTCTHSKHTHAHTHTHKLYVCTNSLFLSFPLKSHTHTHIFTHTHTHTHTHTLTHSHTHKHTQTHTHTNTPAHTHTHTRSGSVVNNKFPAVGTKHQPPAKIGSNFYPSLGPYSSRNATIIHEHVKMMAQAGVCVCVCVCVRVCVCVYTRGWAPLRIYLSLLQICRSHICRAWPWAPTTSATLLLYVAEQCVCVCVVCVFALYVCLCLCLSFLCVCVCRGLFRGFIDHFCKLVEFFLRVSSARPLAPIAVTTLYVYIYVYVYIYIYVYIHKWALHIPIHPQMSPTYQHAFRDGYCSTIQGLLDWFDVDLGFPELVLFRLMWILSVFVRKWALRINNRACRGFCSSHDATIIHTHF